MTLAQIFLLFGAAFLAGAQNSVAGGGSFITLPALIFTGIPAKFANTTSTVALWPGSVASVFAYYRELAAQNRVLVILLSVISLIGGILGAELLLNTSQTTFVVLLPYLLLIATVLFAISAPFTRWLRQRNKEKGKEKIQVEKEHLSWLTLVGVSVIQMIISIYGGYFGGGIGILMLAALGLMGMEDINVMNGLKTLLASVINGVAVITFIIAGVVDWPQAIVMIIGAIIGGYGGAYYARKIDQRIVRAFVIAVGAVMTLYFFIYRSK